jgi:hypothetical protein
MRSFARIALAAIVIAAAASAASAAPAGERTIARVDCGAKALTFLFWPQGHNAIPSIGFPSYPPPHMEVYTPAAGTYPNQNEVAVIEFTSGGQTAGGFAKSCKPVKAKLVNSKPVKAKRTTATALTCHFPKTAQLEYKKYTAPSIAISLTATLRSKTLKAPLEVQAYITAAGSILRYDPKYCKAFPPPQ